MHARAGVRAWDGGTARCEHNPQTASTLQTSSAISGGDKLNEVRSFFFIGLSVSKCEHLSGRHRQLSLVVPCQTGLNQAVPLHTELQLMARNKEEEPKLFSPCRLNSTVKYFMTEAAEYARRLRYNVLLLPCVDNCAVW